MIPKIVPKPPVKTTPPPVKFSAILNDPLDESSPVFTCIPPSPPDLPVPLSPGTSAPPPLPPLAPESHPEAPPPPQATKSLPPS